MPIPEARAQRIARSHACTNCGEYSFKRLKVKRASRSHKEALGEEWHISRTCGVCGMEDEIGIDAEGDVVYGV